MNCVAVTRNGARPRVAFFDLSDCLLLGHPARHSEVYAIARLVRAVASFG